MLRLAQAPEVVYAGISRHAQVRWLTEQAPTPQCGNVGKELPVDGGRRTHFHFRSRWTTTPWWFTLGGWLVVVPTDLVMSRACWAGSSSAQNPSAPTVLGTRARRSQ